MVLAVAHPNPWASASSYLSSHSPSPILAATFMPPRGRPTLVVLSPVAVDPLSHRSPLPRSATAPPPGPLPCSRSFSRLSAQLCPPRGIFWPLEFIELSSRKLAQGQGRLFSLLTPTAIICRQVMSLLRSTLSSHFGHLYLHG